MNRSVLIRAALVIAPLFLNGCALASGFVGGVFGVRSGYEESSHTLKAQIASDVEVREYAPRLAAEVRMEARGNRGANSGFRTLFRYITGNNRSRSEVAMTTPVEVVRPSEDVAMTVPVEVSGDAIDTSATTPGSMRFFLPASYTMATAPEPADPRVKIIEIPAQTVAAYRFSGAPDDADLEEAREYLLTVLKSSDWAPRGRTFVYYYDPPFTIPAMRRNEVLVNVVPRKR